MQEAIVILVVWVVFIAVVCWFALAIPRLIEADPDEEADDAPR